MNKPITTIISSLPPTPENFSAAFAFIKASRLKAQEIEAEERRLRWLAKCPVAVPGWPFPSAEANARVQAWATAKWRDSVWNASDADLLAIAERYPPGEVDTDARDRLRFMLGHMMMAGKGDDCPEAWWELASDTVFDIEEMERWEAGD